MGGINSIFTLIYTEKYLDINPPIFWIQKLFILILCLILTRVVEMLSGDQTTSKIWPKLENDT